MGQLRYLCGFRWGKSKTYTVFRKYALFLCLSFFGEIVFAQDFTLINNFALQNTPIAVSYDEKGIFFIADVLGNITKYDLEGNILLQYSDVNNPNIFFLEGFYTQKIFVFFQEKQKFIFLDRFLNPIGAFQINPEMIGFARIASLSNDMQIWIFDETDLQLKKYQPELNLFSLQTDLSLVLPFEEYDFNFIKEYQNLLFINDLNEGVLIFDNFGNFQKQLLYQDISYLSFYENKLYFFAEVSLIKYDLYSFEIEERAFPKEIPKPKFVLKVKEKWVTISNEKAYIFEIKDF